MAGYFLVEAELLPGLPAFATTTSTNTRYVRVTVSSYDNWKGTVQMLYTHLPGTNPEIEPTTGELYVPKNGSVSDYVMVTMASGSTTFEAVASFGPIQESDTEFIAF